MRQLITALIALAVAAALFTPVRAAERDELKATPGLWKNVYRTQASGQPDPITVRWRCISEEQMDNPSVAFGMPMAAPPPACKRTAYSENSKSLSWRYTCVSGETTLNSQGLIAFDKPQHYTGEIKLDGVAMGYPIQNVIEVEGFHRAACTDPED
ncbi:MAG: DUF3617 family protein [Candidatus Binataceae bacterium]